MSLSIVHTRAALGVNAPPITVEVHISKGLPGLTMVGLPETTVKEARDRVRSVDGIQVGEGRCGPVTKRIQQAFFGLFTGETEDKWGWLDQVNQ